MDAQPKIGGFGCFKGVLQLAIVDKLNRAGFVVAPYNTPEEVPSVKSVSGPARHVGRGNSRGCF